MTRLDQLAGPVGETRAISTAGGGTALSTTASYVHLTPGTDALQMLTRNFSTAVVAKLGFCPWLVVLKTSDAFAAAANVTEYSSAAQDGDAATDVVLSSLDTLANGDSVWIGSHLPFAGLQADVDAANGTANTIAAHYYDGATMTTLSPTDGTASGGASLAVDGAITWTVPADWAKAKLRALASIAVPVPYADDDMYWVRLSWSAALDSSTTLNSLIALPRSTAYQEIPVDSELALRVTRGQGGISAIRALTDAGTGNLIVNAIALSRFV